MHITIGVAVIALFWIWRRGRRHRQRRHEHNRRAKTTPSPSAIVTNAQNVELYVHLWTTSEPHAVVLLIHSYSWDGSAFNEVAEALTQRGFEAVSYDWQGHGHSGTWQSTRGDLQKFEHLITDAERIAQFIRRRYPLLPIFVLGDGYGATIGIHLSLRYRLDGLVLCGAIIVPDVDPHPPSTIPPVLFALEKILPEMLISTTASIRRTTETQPTLRSMIQEHRGLHRLTKKLHQVTCPFVVMHGMLDTRANVQHSKTLFAEAKSQDKTSMIYDQMGSCLFAEGDDDRSQVMTDVLAWLDAHTPRRCDAKETLNMASSSKENTRRRRRMGYLTPRARRRKLP